MLRKYSAAVIVCLALPHDTHSCPLEPEVEAADAAEDRADI
jgi:hypothetical protein